MDLDLLDKHVLITGGSRGIGYACAQHFLREGCVVSLVGRDADALDTARSHLDPHGKRVAVFTADLTRPADALRMIEHAEDALGPIDVLVNAAGSAKQKPFAELEPMDWRTAMDAKFMTYINVMDPIVKRMADQGGGAIVNIIGLGGKLPITTHLPGGAANAALMLATSGLAMAYAPHGVRINGINPAKTQTDRVAHGIEAQARQNNMSVEATLAKARKDIPIGRFASPDDVASAVVFLASPRAGYISGVIVTLDGAGRPVIV